MDSVTYFTPTICSLMKIPEPNISSANPSTEVIRGFNEKIGGKQISKALIYAPDAIGEMILKKHPYQVSLIKEISSIQIKLKSELPTYTSVNYASMFTGSTPEVHGINAHIKPILECDTLFDALAREEKNTALIAVEDCSNSIIFQNKDIDYFIKKNDEEIENIAIDLIKSEKYDVILVDKQDYDKILHKTTPYSDEAVVAFKKIIDSFTKLSHLFLEKYKDYNRLVTFISDHGAHVNEATQKGDHGTDLYDDVMLRHFWGVYSKKV